VAKLLLDLFQLGDVGGKGDEMGLLPPLVSDRIDRHQGGKGLAVLPAPPDLTLPGSGRQKCLAMVFIKRLVMAFKLQNPHVPAEDLLPRIAGQPTERRVYVDDVGRKVGYGDHLIAALENIPGQQEFFLCCFLFGDILTDGLKSCYVSVLVKKRAVCPPLPADLPVGPDAAVFYSSHRTRGSDRGDMLPRLFPVLFRNEGYETSTHQFLGRLAEIAATGFIDEADRPIRSQAADEKGNVFQNGVEIGPAFLQFNKSPAGTQQVIDMIAEGGPVDRLGEEVGSAGGKGAADRVRIVEAGHHRHGQAPALRPFAQFSQGGEAVHARHEHIEQHGIRLPQVDSVERRHAVFGLLHGKSRLLQGFAHQQAHGRIVIHDQDQRPFPRARHRFISPP